MHGIKEKKDIFVDTNKKLSVKCHYKFNFKSILNKNKNELIKKNYVWQNILKVMHVLTLKYLCVTNK